MESEKSYSGHDYEFDLVGKIDTADPSYLESLKDFQKQARSRWNPAYGPNSLPLKEAVEITKEYQPWDPTNPNKEFAKELRLALAEKLRLKTDEDLERIKFFTAVGGPLDAHGIDCFITYKAKTGRGGKEYIVSYDVTKNPDKEILKGADLFIEGDVPDPSDSDFDEAKYLKVVDDYAQKSLSILRAKMGQRKEGFRRMEATA